MTGSLQIKYNKFFILLNLKDINGKRLQKWISTGLSAKGNRKNAEKALRDCLAEYEKQSDCYSSDISFIEYMNNWLQTTKQNVELTTWESYMQYYNGHIKPYFTGLDLKLSEVKPPHIQGFIDMKTNGGRLDGKPGGLNPKSIRKFHCIIRGCLKDALTQNLILYNPADRVKLPRKSSSFVGKFYNIEQANRLMTVANDTDAGLAIMLALYYGLRRSEILGLKWSSVDLKNNTMLIENVIVRCTTVVEKQTTKNKSSHRTLPIMPGVKERLQKERKKQLENKLFFGGEYIDNDFVCKFCDGRQFGVNYLTTKLKKITKANDLPHIRFHDLRHTTASLLLSLGFSLKEIQEWLGHHDISTTADIYGHLDFEAKKNIARGFDNIIKIS